MRGHKNHVRELKMAEKTYEKVEKSCMRARNRGKDL